MGIVNVTPDSFSDGGRYLDPEAAVDHALALAGEGADLIDIGGESTRPQAAPVPEAEELRRVLPVLDRLAGRLSVPISIDTRKPAVARAALEAGAGLVNDIAANREDPALWEVVATFGAGYVCTHMQGTPQTMQENPRYADVVREVGAFFADRLDRLDRHGVPAEQVALDVGIGFGKSLDHNLDLLAQVGSYKKLSRPMVLGVSRKSFLGKLSGAGVADRLPASLACAAYAVLAGVQVIRTHDVGPTRQAVRSVEALQERKP
ncbi:MAG TPA: dihydropteroate synthase [Verrucomicrobiota bacterium]|nr:dihydropteroate synthase [Verrucomicrobiota bacterium]HNU49329.1 dihydropteroate synthase [Verrucomicrobiota bacterium]